MGLEGIVGANVLRLRKQRGLTQEALAHNAAISVRYLSAVEHGEENMTLQVLARLAAALGTTPTELVSAGAAKSRKQ